MKQLVNQKLTRARPAFTSSHAVTAPTSAHSPNLIVTPTRQTSTPAHTMNAPTSKPKVDNSPTCATCQWYYEDHADPIQPGCPACAMKEHTRGEYHRACTLYTPKQTD